MPLGAGEPSRLHAYLLLFFCVVPHLICCGTRGSNTSPLQRFEEMLRLLAGAEEAPLWEIRG